MYSPLVIDLLLVTTHALHPLLCTIPVLAAVAFLTLLERKLLGYMQARKGPNIVGPHGLFQPLSDGVKLFIKEPVYPNSASPLLFLISPAVALALSLLLWAPLPMPYPLANLTLAVLFVMAISSLSVYSILGSGWASNSKYALIGALRAVAQTISYEVSLGLLLLSAIMLTGSFTLQAFTITQEANWLIITVWPVAASWYVSTLAETNRSPFDLTEGESELVSGFNVEYAAGPFALFFLAEYANILLMNTLSTILFLGGSPYVANLPMLTTMLLMIKATFLASMFLWVRATCPRFRYDQLMHLTWKNFLPLALAMVVWNLAIPVALAGLPPQY